MKRIFLYSIQFFICTTFAFSQISENKVSAWLNRNKKELTASGSDTDMRNLQWMKEEFKNLKVIGLGESTHGTHEFFSAKSRVIKFLVKEMGYRNIVIEASNLLCRPINNYILTGIGKPAELLLQLDPFSGGCAEMMDLVEWLRLFNSTIPVNDKVKFRGLDIQDKDNRAIFSLVKNYLQKVDPVYAVSKDSLLSIMNLLVDWKFNYSGLRNAQKFIDSSFVKFYIFLSNLAINKGVYIAKSSAKEYETVMFEINMIAARLINSYNDKFIDFRFNYKWSKRDYYMANIFFQFIQEEKPEAKFIVWSHNNHISINPESNESENVKPLGSHLKDALGDRYYSIGFFFGQGSFYAEEVTNERKRLGITEFKVSLPDKDCIEWWLKGSGGNYFLNIRKAVGGDLVIGFISSTFQTWNFGWGVVKGRENEYKVTTVLEKDFDGLIFISKTSMGSYLKED